jgi:hypothetical protein
MSAPSHISYDVRGIIYDSVCMTRVQYMMRISGITIIISDPLNMLLVSYFKCSYSLTYISQWAV